MNILIEPNHSGSCNQFAATDTNSSIQSHGLDFLGKLFQLTHKSC